MQYMATNKGKKKATRKKTPESNTGAATRAKATKSTKSQKSADVAETVANRTTAKSEERTKTRLDWETNQVMIQEAFIKLLKKKKRKPTAVELAEETGLSTRSIDRHIKQMKFDMQNDTWRALTPAVMHSIFKGATRGGVFAQKLWLQVVESWSEDINVNHGAQESLADMIAESTGIKMRKNIEKNAKHTR